MTPQRRDAAIQLLAQLDQAVAEAEASLAEELISADEREAKCAQLEFRRGAIVAVEELLSRGLRRPIRDR